MPFYRCRNSINILTRQEKAAKLNTCICDGSEDYDCRGIHRNMNRLCFGKAHNEYEIEKIIGDTSTNEIVESRANIRSNGYRFIINRTILAVTMALFILITRQGKNPGKIISNIE